MQNIEPNLEYSLARDLHQIYKKWVLKHRHDSELPDFDSLPVEMQRQDFRFARTVKECLIPRAADMNAYMMAREMEGFHPYGKEEKRGPLLAMAQYIKRRFS